MFCAGAAGRSGAAAGDAGIVLSRFMYPATDGALSRLSGAATLDTGILGSECAGAQDVGSQRNEHCAKNAFPNSLFMVKSFLSCVAFYLWHLLSEVVTAKIIRTKVV